MLINKSHSSATTSHGTTNVFRTFYILFITFTRRGISAVMFFRIFYTYSTEGLCGKFAKKTRHFRGLVKKSTKMYVKKKNLELFDDWLNSYVPSKSNDDSPWKSAVLQLQVQRQWAFCSLLFRRERISKKNNNNHSWLTPCPWLFTTTTLAYYPTVFPLFRRLRNWLSTWVIMICSSPTWALNPLAWKSPLTIPISLAKSGSRAPSELS